MIIGLPPPMYPVHGLERSDASDKRLDTDEDNQAFGKKRALQRLSPDDKRAEIEREVRREVAWRKGDKAPAKKRGLLASFFSSKTLCMHVLTTAPSSPHRYVGKLLLFEDTARRGGYSPFQAKLHARCSVARLNEIERG
jgi:hypothetical protein